MFHQCFWWKSLLISTLYMGNSTWFPIFSEKTPWPRPLKLHSISSVHWLGGDWGDRSRWPKALPADMDKTVIYHHLGSLFFNPPTFLFLTYPFFKTPWTLFSTLLQTLFSNPLESFLFNPLTCLFNPRPSFFDPLTIFFSPLQLLFSPLTTLFQPASWPQLPQLQR